MHSLACTASGQVFVWGLILVSEEEASRSAAPVPTSDGNQPPISPDGNDADGPPPPDVAAAAAAGDARAMLGLTNQMNDTLRRIVRESNVKWATSTEEPIGAAADGPAEVDADEAAAEARAAVRCGKRS
jgi:hypothetical protein